MPLRLLCSALLLFVVAGCTSAPAKETSLPESVLAKPRMVEYPWMTIERWYRMHAEDVGIAAQGNVDLLFIGDSITEGWPVHLMEQYFGEYRPANFGIGGDQTDNILWRLRHGSAGMLEPKVVSLLIGVNNFGLRNDSPEEVIDGVTAVVDELRLTFPGAKILVHGIFPYKQFADSPERERVKTVNRAVAQLADGERVFFLDIGGLFLEPNGDLSPEIMPDFLHLSEQAYQIWGEALTPVIAPWFVQE